jgi:hypothetical protein
MPIEMKYLDDGRGVIYIGEGIVTGEDIISANRQFFSSKEIMTKRVSTRTAAYFGTWLAITSKYFRHDY